jgi:hypothetical protein
VTTAGLPDVIAPMLATLGATPTGPGWGYEFKWDGVRAISYIEPFGARVLSRNDREVTGSYPELRETVRLLGDRQAVLDGEIVALDTAGRPSFAQLQRRMHVHEPLQRANTRYGLLPAALLVGQAARRYWLMTPPRTRVRRSGPSNATMSGSWLGGCWSRLWCGR